MSRETVKVEDYEGSAISHLIKISCGIFFANLIFPPPPHIFASKPAYLTKE